jgi:hypothetical protein
VHPLPFESTFTIPISLFVWKVLLIELNMIGFVEGKNQNQNRIVLCSESE